MMLWLKFVTGMSMSLCYRGLVADDEHDRGLLTLTSPVKAWHIQAVVQQRALPPPVL